MTDISKTIEIIFSGIDDLSQTVSTMEKSTDSFGSKIENLGHGLEAVGEPFKILAENILKVDTLLASLAGVTIALAVKEAGIFNTSLSEINTLLELSGSDLDAYSNQIQEYAQTSTQSMENITTALYNAASLGVSYSDSLETLTAAERLAVGTKTDLNSALETLVGTMNAYGAPMSEITGYSDAFFTIIKDGKTTLPELAMSIADVTGIAAAAGVDFDTLGAAIAAMTASGAPTSQAITKIKAAIEALLSPTPSAAKAAEALGINLGEAAIKSKGFPAVLQEIYEKTGGSAQAMGDIIPTIEGLQGALILGADKSGIFAKALEDMANKTGATTKAFDEMKDNSNLIWQNMVNNWVVMLEKFGLEIMDHSNGMVSSFSELWKSVAASADEGTFKPLTDAINSFFDEISRSIKTVAENLPEALKQVDFSGLLNSLGGIGDEIEGMFDGIDISTPEGLAKAIQGVVDALELLANTTKGVISSFKPVIDAVSDMSSEFSGLDPDIQEFIGNIVGLGTQLAILGGVVAGGGALISGISSFVGFFSAGGALSTGVSSVIGLLTGPAGLVAAMLSVAAAGASFFTGDTFQNWAADTKRAIAEADFSQWADSTSGYFKDVSKASSENLSGMDASLLTTGKNADNTGEQIGDLVSDTEMIPSHKETEFEVKEDGSIGNIVSDIDTIPSHKETAFSAKTDQASMDDAKKAADKAMPDEKTTTGKAATDAASYEKAKKAAEDAIPKEKTTTGKINPDAPSIASTKAKIADAIPESKMMEIQLQGNIDLELARIKASAETAQTAFEWTAKLDIAQVQAEADMMVAAFESVGTSVDATAAAAADMFGALSDAGIHFYEMRDLVVWQMQMEEQALNMQQKLVDAQIKYMEARASALGNGDGLIKISSDGLEPILEELLWNVMEKVKLRATEEAAEFLLGLDSIL